MHLRAIRKPSIQVQVRLCSDPFQAPFRMMFVDRREPILGGGASES